MISKKNKKQVFIHFASVQCKEVNLAQGEIARLRGMVVLTWIQSVEVYVAALVINNFLLCK